MTANSSRCTMAAAGLVAIAVVAGRAEPRDQGSRDEVRHTRHVTVSASTCGYQPAEIDVNQGDEVTVAFHATDNPHSFVVDEYRIAKRAASGQTVTFEFRAERSGRFPIYCNLQHEHTCAPAEGILVVRSRLRPQS